MEHVLLGIAAIGNCGVGIYALTQRQLCAAVLLLAVGLACLVVLFGGFHP